MTFKLYDPSYSRGSLSSVTQTRATLFLLLECRRPHEVYRAGRCAFGATSETSVKVKEESFLSTLETNRFHLLHCSFSYFSQGTLGTHHIQQAENHGRGLSKRILRGQEKRGEISACMIAVLGRERQRAKLPFTKISPADRLLGLTLQAGDKGAKQPAKQLRLQ